MNKRYRTMKQTTISAGSFDRYSKMMRRAAFLFEMNQVAPPPQNVRASFSFIVVYSELT
jgi:hypothetical protein